MSAETVFAAAIRVLLTPETAAKAEAAGQAVADWKAGALQIGEPAAPPDRPARPAKPELLSPTAMPRRSTGGEKGRAALLHAVAHIELNAVDLAFDMIARFTGSKDIAEADRRAFIDDWMKVGGEEASHFRLVSKRLSDFGAGYGDLPAHDGLWEAAYKTRGDVLARLAIAPMVLEARGLDVTPGMIAKLEKAGDADSAAVLNVIYTEEVGHVAIGAKWFAAICAARKVDEKETFHTLVETHFPGGLKPPFNDAARRKAGLLPDLYMGLAQSPRGQ